MRSVVVLCVAVFLLLSLSGCRPGQRASTGLDVAAGVRATAPAATGEPGRDRSYRSYPAPTGAPGFRRYYQIRCYPGCHTGTTPAAPTEAAANAVALEQETAERPYRSYPAPTGAAGFRRYYQMRCYPGCHSYPSATPAATRIHP